MLTKLSTFKGVDSSGEPLVRVFHQGDSIRKVAGQYQPEVQDFLSSYKSDLKKIALLVNALGGSEYWGQNVNGDVFPWGALTHDCRAKGHRAHPVDEFYGKVLPAYGYTTFLDAHPFVHHKNKDPERAFGSVAVSCLNRGMKRVELVTLIDRDLAAKFDAQSFVDRIDAGDFPDVSMGCRVPYDVCTICGYRSRSPKDYCSHVKELGMNYILPDGRRVGVVNLHPRFFDISFVFIGADRTAKVMTKLGSAGLWLPRSILDAQEIYGAANDDEGNMVKAAANMTKRSSMVTVPGTILRNAKDLEEPAGKRLLDELEVDRLKKEDPASTYFNALVQDIFDNLLDDPRVKEIQDRVSQDSPGHTDGVLHTNHADAVGIPDPDKMAAFKEVVAACGCGEDSGQSRLRSLMELRDPERKSEVSTDIANWKILDESEKTANRLLTAGLGSLAGAGLGAVVSDEGHRGRGALLGGLAGGALGFAGGSPAAAKAVRTAAPEASAAAKAAPATQAAVKAAPVAQAAARPAETVAAHAAPGTLAVHSAPPPAARAASSQAVPPRPATGSTAVRAAPAETAEMRSLNEEMRGAIAKREERDVISRLDHDPSRPYDDFFDRPSRRTSPLRYGSYGNKPSPAAYRASVEKMIQERGGVVDPKRLPYDQLKGMLTGTADARAKQMQAAGTSDAFLDDHWNRFVGSLQKTSEARPSEEVRKLRGLEIKIEYKAGSTRTGKDWKRLMKNDYGEIVGSHGSDGDPVDVYIGPKESADKVFIVHQNHAFGPKKGQYDEDKVMLGFGSSAEAKKAYLDHYDRPGFFRSITEMDFDQFKALIFHKDIKGEKIAQDSNMEKVAASLEELFDAGANGTAIRRERLWKDKVTNHSTYHVGSGLGERFETMQKTAAAAGDVLDEVFQIEGGEAKTGAELVQKWASRIKAAAKKHAQDKKADIDKEIEPDAATGIIVENLSKQEEKLPAKTLDAMGKKGLEKGLSTSSLMGMVLKPEEFQRILLAAIGKTDLADELDQKKQTFEVNSSGPSEAPCGCLEPGHFDSSLMQMLLPSLEGRSYLGPVIKRRISVIVYPPAGREPEHEATDSPLLSKVGAAYNWYRTEMMKVATYAPDAMGRYPELHARAYGSQDVDIFSKQAVDQNSAGAMLASIPLSLMYAASLRKDIEQGKDVGLLKYLLASHPYLTALGTGALVRELMKHPELNRIVGNIATEAAGSAQRIIGGA